MTYINIRIVTLFSLLLLFIFTTVLFAFLFITTQQQLETVNTRNSQLSSQLKDLKDNPPTVNLEELFGTKQIWDQESDLIISSKIANYNRIGVSAGTITFGNIEVGDSDHSVYLAGHDYICDTYHFYENIAGPEAEGEEGYALNINTKPCLIYGNISELHNDGVIIPSEYVLIREEATYEGKTIYTIRISTSSEEVNYLSIETDKKSLEEAIKEIGNSKVPVGVKLSNLDSMIYIYSSIYSGEPNAIQDFPEVLKRFDDIVKSIEFMPIGG